jgi:hypothetical protein
LVVRKPLRLINPRFDGTAFEQWSRNFVNKNFWRVEEVHLTKEDSIQECAVVFFRCKNKYSYTVDNLAWFMSLFKRAVSNEFHVASVKNTLRRENEIVSSVICDTGLQQMTDDNIGPLMQQLRACGNELRDAIEIMHRAPDQYLSCMLGHESQIAIERGIRRMTFCKSPLVHRLFRAFYVLRQSEPQAAEEALLLFSAMLDDADPL